MLRFIFWILLSVNVVLLAYGQGLFGSDVGGEREPARIKNQLNTRELVVVTADQARQAAAGISPSPSSSPSSPSSKPAAPAVAVPPPVLACVEISNVAAADTRRVDALLSPLRLGERLVRDAGPAPEITSHIVFIPPAANREAAQQRAAELKELGITNFFIMNDDSPMKNAISLGVFKSEAAAQTLLAAVKAQGATNAKVAGRSSQVTRVTWRLRELDPATRARVDAILDKMPEHEAHRCR